VVDDQPDASMPSNLEVRRADQSSGGRDHFRMRAFDRPKSVLDFSVLDFLQRKLVGRTETTLYRFDDTRLGSCGVRSSAGELLAVLRNG
jgi:hypothetical protein